MQAQALSEERFRSSAPTWVAASVPESDAESGAELGPSSETTAAAEEAEGGDHCRPLGGQAEGLTEAAVVQNVGVAWQPSEFDDFPMRATCLCPSTTISDLTPALKARLWRYLSDVFGKHYPEMVEVIHHMDVTNGR